MSDCWMYNCDIIHDAKREHEIDFLKKKMEFGTWFTHTSFISLPGVFIPGAPFNGVAVEPAGERTGEQSGGFASSME